LSGGDKFQQFLRIIQPFFEIVLFAEGSGCELRGDAGVLQARIGGHEANFIQADALGAGERGFELNGEFRWLSFAGWKGARKSADFFLRNRGKELNAGEPCGGKQLGELFFGGSAFEGNAIEQELRAGGAEHQAVVGSRGDSSPEFVPRDVQLFGSAGVLEAVQAGELQEYVKASYEGPTRSRLSIR
jgi:hypothetical protein